MAMLVTAQGSWPVTFSNSYVASGATGRIDYVIRTDDTSFDSYVEYKFYVNASSDVVSYFGTIYNLKLSTYTKASASASSYRYSTTDSSDYSISAKADTDTLIASGTIATPQPIHNPSTGVPYYIVGIDMIFGIKSSSGTSYSASTADSDENLLDLSVAVGPTTISSSAGFLGEAVTINLVHKISGVYANITYEIGNATGYVANGVTASSYNWTIPSELIVEFGETEIQKEMILTCDSYIDGVLLGTTQAKLTVFLPSGELTPVINPTVVDINPATVALTGNENSFVRYKSIAEYAINAAAVKGAQIVKQQVKNGSIVIDNIPSGSIPNVETGVFEFLAIDNRDMGTSMTLTTPNFVEYIKLTCNQKITMEVSGETGATATVRIFGNYFKGSFGATDNTLKIEIRHTDNDGNMVDWVDVTSFAEVTTTNGTYDVDFGISGLNYSVTYIFQCRATDKLGTVTTSEYVLKVLPVFDWSEDDFNFNVDTTINGDLYFPAGAIHMGNNLIIADGDKLTIVADKLELASDNISYGATPLEDIKCGNWTPEFASENAIASYNEQTGWYQRIGDVVTVGFNISAICNAGFTGTSLVINGLPFTPEVTAFGGGVASKVHVAGGNNFQCWAANTDGTITARIQACNNTAVGALTTSASGMYYGTSDAAITVGGTITYRIVDGE